MRDCAYHATTKENANTGSKNWRERRVIVYILIKETRYNPVHVHNIAHLGTTVVTVSHEPPKHMPVLNRWLANDHNHRYNEIRYTLHTQEVS